jgi:hypothetical protein
LCVGMGGGGRGQGLLGICEREEENEEDEEDEEQRCGCWDDYSFWGGRIMQCRGMDLASLGSLSHNTDGRVDSALLCSASPCFESVLPFSLVTNPDLIQRMQVAKSLPVRPICKTQPCSNHVQKAVGGKIFPEPATKKITKTFPPSPRCNNIRLIQKKKRWKTSQRKRRATPAAGR